MLEDGQLVSVVIPAYNVEDFIGQTVTSVRDQSYAALEIVVVDDGSTDGTAQVCDELAANDPRIRILHKKNGGLSEARNHGVQHARGDYLCFLDGDDVLDRDTIRDSLEALTSSGANVAICSLQRITELSGFAKEHPEPFKPVRANRYVESILRGRESVSACGKLAATGKWREHPFPVGRLYEDIAPVLGLLSGTSKLVVTSTGYYGYLVRPNSITAGRTYDERHVRDVSFVLEQARRSMAGNAPELRGSWPTFFALARLRIAGRLPGKKSELSTQAVREFAAHTRKDMPKLTLGRAVSPVWRIRALLYGVSPALYKGLFGLYARLTGKHSFQ